MKQKHKIAILLAAMLVIAGCGGGGGTLDDTESVRQAAQMKLDDAVMELKDAVTAGDIPAPTQALIGAIEEERRELQEAIDNAAPGVDTAAATELITSSDADLIRIRDKFASLPLPTEPTGTTSSTGTTGTTTTGTTTGNNNNNNFRTSFLPK